VKASDPRMYIAPGWFYDVTQKYGLYLLGALGGRSYEAFAEDIVKSASLSKGDAVLDAGCGTGYLFPALAKTIGKMGRIEGVDFSRAHVKAAERRIAKMGLVNARARVGRVEDIADEYPADGFNAVFCSAVLPVLKDAGLAMRGMVRVLKPGGRLVIWTISRESLATTRFKCYWDWSIRKFDLKFYTQTELREMYLEAGLNDPVFGATGLSLICVGSRIA